MDNKKYIKAPVGTIEKLKGILPPQCLFSSTETDVPNICIGGLPVCEVEIDDMEDYGYEKPLVDLSTFIFTGGLAISSIKVVGELKLPRVSVKQLLEHPELVDIKERITNAIYRNELKEAENLIQLAREMCG